MTRYIIPPTVFVALFWVVTGCVSAQFTVQLKFEFVPGENDKSPQYSWRGDIGFTTTSPGGSTVSNLERATFESFEALFDDIIGDWQITSFSNETVTFTVSNFNESSFPFVELTEPLDGASVISGQVVTTDISPLSDEFVGKSLNLQDINNLEIDFLDNFAFQPILLDNNLQGSVQVARRVGMFLENIVANQAGQTVAFSVNSTILVQSFTNRANVTVINSLLGDINQDGNVDLLDIAPLVEIIVASEFLFEADVNQDGNVDLLDVVPFVALLTG